MKQLKHGFNTLERVPRSEHGKRGHDDMYYLRRLWDNMLIRVDTCKSYENVSISDEWRNFETFCNTVCYCVGFDEWLYYMQTGKGEPYQLDKDYLHYLNTGNTHGILYSVETCAFIPQSLNIKLQRLEKQKPLLAIKYDKQHNIDDIKFYERLQDVKQDGFSTSKVCDCLKVDSDRSTHKGYTFNYVHYCRLPQALELKTVNKHEYDILMRMIDGEEIELPKG